VCDADSLEPLKRITGKVVLLGAIRLEPVRLIDNLLVKGTAKGLRGKVVSPLR
jgi:pantothenate synthetase